MIAADHRAGVAWAAEVGFGGEQERLAGEFEAAEGGQLAGLVGAVPLEQLDCGFVQGDVEDLVVLRVFEDQPVLGADPVAVQPQPLLGPVEVVPLERDDLAAPGTGDPDAHVCRPHSQLCSNARRTMRQLIGAWRVRLRPGFGGQLDAWHRVERHQSPPHGRGERPAEDGVDLADAGRRVRPALVGSALGEYAVVVADGVCCSMNGRPEHSWRQRRSPA